MFTVNQTCHVLKIIVIHLMFFESCCYEKTLRKIVRDQMKMVQRPFSDMEKGLKWTNSSHILPQMFMRPGYSQVKTVIRKVQRPKIATILSSVETNNRKSSYSRLIDSKKKIQINDIRFAHNGLINITTALQDNNNALFPEFKQEEINRTNQPVNFSIETIYQIPPSKFFPSISERPLQLEYELHNKDNSISAPEYTTMKEKKMLIQSIIHPRNKIETVKITDKLQAIDLNVVDPDIHKTDYVIEVTSLPNFTQYVSSPPAVPYTCTVIRQVTADVDFQDKFSDLDIEPPWTFNKRFWNQIYQSRYEYLMRSSKWPALKVILIPRTHVDTIWTKPFEQLHTGTVRKIISSMIKKLTYYSNLTFAWNEVSHLSYWWKSASQKSRTVLRRIVKENRLEITTGGWVETDDATSHIFGLLHQFIEGHQWLLYNLNYVPNVAWLTNSVTHSPTLPYLCSASDMTNLVITNIHFSMEQYLAEYQYSDFVWLQNWHHENTAGSRLNKALNKIGKERLPNHSILTHYLQFNSDGFKACGPEGDVCLKDFNFVNSNKHVNIDPSNIKEKSEIILEQYSKTGTLSAHNIIMAPIGGPYQFEAQSEFDYQYNNYKKIMDFINTNKHIYKASVVFGTPKDYFRNMLESHKFYPTVTGDLLNFADISSRTPTYWTGFFTSRPYLKILLRRLHSTLRTTEILLSFSLSHNVLESYNNMTDLFKRLLSARENVARLQDRNVVSGTLTAKALRYVYSKISKTVKDCWHIQQVAASFLSSKPGQNTIHLEKYIIREGEFISNVNSVAGGDKIYVFNSLSQERTEVVELNTRNPNIRIVDYDKREVAIQIKPTWKYASDKIIISRQFYKILFTVVLPPMAFGMFRVINTYDAIQSASTIYCVACVVEINETDFQFPFDVQPLQTGDIQVENYKHRLIFDEFSGFLRTVVEKTTGRQKPVAIDYGAFISSKINSGMFLFNTNSTKPLADILLPYKTGAKSKLNLIISGSITTEVIVIYGKLLQHTVKIFNLLNTPLDDVITVQSKIDYEISPKNREIEMFLSFQTDIVNGNPLQLFTDNNGFQFTSRTINISRRIESNVYPITSMVFIQDSISRFTVITDHAQGVTALQEGQLVIMLDRRVLFNDNRGTDEGLADNTPTIQTHYILLENFDEVDTSDQKLKLQIESPSLSAMYHLNSLTYDLDVFFVNQNQGSLLHYVFLPLVKTTLPCDVYIINYRLDLNTFFTEKYMPSTALLTLHRQGFSCRFYYNKVSCGSDKDFELIKTFRGIKETYQSNLVGTSKGVPIKKLNLRNFPSMELLTLKVHFETKA